MNSNLVIAVLLVGCSIALNVHKQAKAAEPRPIIEMVVYIKNNCFACENFHKTITNVQSALFRLVAVRYKNIEEDANFKEEAKKLGIDGVPAFIVHGKIYRGEVDYWALLRIIEEKI